MKGQKINKKGNTVVAVVCLLIGLALLAGGIYLLVAGGEAVNGGIMVGLGALIIALFGCTMYLIVNFENCSARRKKRRRERRKPDVWRAEWKRTDCVPNAGPSSRRHCGGGQGKVRKRRKRRLKRHKSALNL